MMGKWWLKAQILAVLYGRLALAFAQAIWGAVFGKKCPTCKIRLVKGACLRCDFKLPKKHGREK
jgi:hypothetical protein